MPVIRTYIDTPKSVLIPGIHSIFYAGYKNMPVIRTLYAVPDDVLITGIHCTVISKIKFESLSAGLH